MQPRFASDHRAVDSGRDTGNRPGGKACNNMRARRTAEHPIMLQSVHVLDA